METEIELSEYSKEKINLETPGRMDMEKKKRKLVEVVNDAHVVLKHAKGVKANRNLKKGIEMLKRILQENIEKDQAGNPKEKNYKEKPKDIPVSPVDPDARYGAKSHTKRFTGYKASITDTISSRFITNIKAMPGNRHDGETAVASITEQRFQGPIPPKVIGDAAYGDGSYRRDLKENSTEVVAPLRDKNTRAKGVYPKSMFQYDEKKQTLTCPQGVTAKPNYYDSQNGTATFHFPMSACNRCPVQKESTNDKDGRRTVGITRVHKELMEAERYNLTDQFKEDMKLRPPIEGKVSELTRYHGLRRARCRGLSKVSLQCYFTAVAVNIKRWVKILVEKMTPKAAVVAVS
jgi:hypothetical protein